MALHLGLVLWGDVPIGILEALGLPVYAGRGCDGLSPDLATGMQIKWRATGGRADDAEVAMFLMAMTVLPCCREWLLVMAEGTRLSKNVRYNLEHGQGAVKPRILEIHPQALEAGRVAVGFAQNLTCP